MKINLQRCLPYGLRCVASVSRTSLRCVEKFVKFCSLIFSGFETDEENLYLLAKQCVEAARIFGVNERKGDDEKTHAEMKLNFDYEECNFGKHGLTRFVVHNFMEILMDFKMYTNFFLFVK